MKDKNNKFLKEQRITWCIIFIIMFPFHLIGYFIYSFWACLFKPFKLLYLSKKEMKKYTIQGDFNPCEYMWSTINLRK